MKYSWTTPSPNSCAVPEYTTAPVTAFTTEKGLLSPLGRRRVAWMKGAAAVVDPSHAPTMAFLGAFKG